ncbi:MAG: hypothetical protein KAS12_01335 [Candidatus Aenigmarchaeota archaeon]|nr:hypothetical protein [Candidatus Aenigmarchaeota archaeon]
MEKITYFGVDLHEAEKQIGYSIIELCSAKPSIGRLNNNMQVAIFNITCEYGTPMDTLVVNSIPPKYIYPKFHPTKYNNQLLLNIDSNGVERYFLRYLSDIFMDLDIIAGESALSYYPMTDEYLRRISEYKIDWKYIKNYTFSPTCGTLNKISAEVFRIGDTRFLPVHVAFEDYPEFSISQVERKNLSLPDWANNALVVQVSNGNIFDLSACILKYTP